MILIVQFIFDRVENTVGKGETADNQYFLYCFQNAFFGGGGGGGEVIKVGIVK